MAETGTRQQQGARSKGQSQPNAHPRIPEEKNYEFTHPDQTGSPAWSAKERTGASRTARDFPSCGRRRPARAAGASGRQPSLGECLWERSQSRDSRSCVKCGSSQTTTSMIKLKWQKLLPLPPLPATANTTIPYPGVGLPEKNIVHSLRMSLPGNRAVGCFFYSFALCSFEGPDTQLPNNSLTE